MRPICPVAVKRDQDTSDRLKRLSDSKHRSTHWTLRHAVAQFIDRAEKRAAFRQAGMQALPDDQATGLHVTEAEADDGLAKFAEADAADGPECHG